MMNVSARTAPKLALLGSLYFSQGLPFGFFTQALPVMLRKSGFSLSEIGLASLLALPWALKFLWAPLVDRYSYNKVGRRKSWILPLQFCGVLVLMLLATTVKVQSLSLLMVAVFLLNLIAATQDIATDGLAVDILSTKERGLANGLQVAGYRVGMIVGGGVLLILYDQLGSGGTFLTMALLIGLASIPISITREPQSTDTVFAREAQPAYLHFLRRPGTGQILFIVVAYKAGDAFATGMLRPFLNDVGLTLADIGWLLGSVGFVSGLIGALLGGSLVNPLGRRRSLLFFGLLQALTIAGYAYLAAVKPSIELLYILCAAEHLAGGMATAALFTCMMDWCSRQTAATDYTVQASAVVIATGGAATLAGFSAQALGYLGHFSLAAVLALLALVLVRYFFPTEAKVQAARSTALEVLPCP